MKENQSRITALASLKTTFASMKCASGGQLMQSGKKIAREPPRPLNPTSPRPVPRKNAAVKPGPSCRPQHDRAVPRQREDLCRKRACQSPGPPSALADRSEPRNIDHLKLLSPLTLLRRLPFQNGFFNTAGTLQTNAPPRSLAVFG